MKVKFIRYKTTRWPIMVHMFCQWAYEVLIINECLNSVISCKPLVYAYLSLDHDNGLVMYM